MWQAKLGVLFLFAIFASTCFGDSTIYYQAACRYQTEDLIWCNETDPSKVISITNDATFFGRQESEICPEYTYTYLPSNITNCSLDIVDFMKKRCDGKLTCNLTGTEEFFGMTPCPPDTQVYAAVSYKCVEPEKPTTPAPTEPPKANVDAPTLCYSRSAWIDCGKKKIKTGKIFYGRTDATTCIYTWLHHFSPYFQFRCDGTKSAEKYIQKKCDGKNDCQLWNIMGLGDMCTPAHLPYLRIDHECV